jgi:hypothetical protein
MNEQYELDAGAPIPAAAWPRVRLQKSSTIPTSMMGMDMGMSDIDTSLSYQQSEQSASLSYW